MHKSALDEGLLALYSLSGEVSPCRFLHHLLTINFIRTVAITVSMQILQTNQLTPS